MQGSPFDCAHFDKLSAGRAMYKKIRIIELKMGVKSQKLGGGPTFLS
jgi:hypothetical protein